MPMKANQAYLFDDNGEDRIGVGDNRRMRENTTTRLNSLRAKLHRSFPDNTTVGDALYRAFVQQTLDAIYIYDAETKRILETNQAFLDLLGYTEAEARRLTVNDVVDLDGNHHSVTAYFQEIVVSERASRSERRWRRKDGALIEVQVSANTIEQEGRQFVFVAGRDLTERIRAEQRYRELFEEAPVMYLVVENRDGVLYIKDCNGLFPRTLGYQREEVLGRPLIQFYTRTSQLRVRERESDCQLSQQGRLAPTECQLVARDGRIIYTLLRNAPETNPQGDVVGIRMMHMDIGQTKRVEAELRANAIVNDIARSAAGAPDFQSTLQMLADQLGEVINADGCFITLWDEQRQQTIPAAAYGSLRDVCVGLSVKPGERTMTQSVVEDGRTLVVEDVFNSPHLSPSIAARFPTRALLGLPLMAGAQILGAALIAFNQAHHFTPEEIARAEHLAGPVALAVAKARLLEELKKSHARLAEAYEATLEGWGLALELRDKETEGHTRRVTEMTVRLARAMEIPEDELVHIRRGAWLHDIGKIGIPDNILRKPGRLTFSETAIMRQHPVYAHEMISAIPFLHPAIDIPYRHHEKWDGTGYPGGLRGEAIPRAARLFAVVDVWDALVSDRSYRKAWPVEKVIEHIKLLSSTHFDPAVVEAFLKLLNV